MVAITILALALGALYRAAGGATRNVRTDERYAYSVELARSLLAENAMVPVSGVSARGETAGGFQWRVDTHVDGSKRREVVLNSVVEGTRQ
jgi:general secretion pathway protein I